VMAIGSQRHRANDAHRRAAAQRFGAVVAVIAAVVAAGGPEAAHGDEAGGGSPAGGGATLRIACFNAENLAAPGEETRLTRFRFEPARRRHLEKVADVIETLVPDILVMPEVVSAAGVDAVVRILHEKGLADYRGYHVDGRDKFSGFDVAIVSRIRPDEIDGQSIHLYVPARSQGRDDEQWLQQTMTAPAPDADEAETAGGREGRRGGTVVLQRHAAAFFTVHGRKIGVLGVHLKSNPSSVQSNAQRSAETKIVREIVRRKMLAAGYLPIVLGDINDYDPDVPMADSFRKTQTTVLRDLKDLDPESEGDELVNAARFIPRVADRYTSHWDFNENGAPDGDDVFTMIDHVLVHRDLAPAIARVFICHATGLEISDHFPVVVDFDLAKLP
jgi:endonuclease/exonuclease/phosphatase family metal-dependent hydrolase